MEKNYSITATYKPEHNYGDGLVPLAEQWNIGIEVHVVNPTKIVNSAIRTIKVPPITILQPITDPQSDIPDVKK